VISCALNASRPILAVMDDTLPLLWEYHGYGGNNHRNGDKSRKQW